MLKKIFRKKFCGKAVDWSAHRHGGGTPRAFHLRPFLDRLTDFGLQSKVI